MSRDRYKVTGPSIHFLTCTVVRWIPAFSVPAIADIVISSLRYLQDNKRIALYGYVIMENHIHLIAVSDDLAKEIGDFKTYTANKIMKYLNDNGMKSWLEQFHFYKLSHREDREYQFWQEGSHPIVIQSEKVLNQKLTYMHQNPVRRGYVEEDYHWMYSSARNYAGMKAILPLDGVD